MNKNLKYILYGQTLYFLASQSVWALAVPYLVKNLGAIHVFAVYILGFAIGIISMVKWPIKDNLKRDMMYGLLLTACMYLSFLFLSPNHVLLLVLGVLFGLRFPLYWVPRNTYINLSVTKEKRALYTSMLSASLVITAVFGPSLGGIVVASLGYNVLFFMGAVLLILAMLIVARIEKIKKSIKYGKEKEVGALEGLIVVDGIWQGVHFTVPFIVTYLMLQSELEYGFTFSYLALIAGIATLGLGWKSKTEKSREDITLASLALTGVASIGAGLADNFLQWIVFLSIIQLLKPIKTSFFFALVADKARDMGTAMIDREVYMNLGRIAGVSIGIVCLLFLGDAKISYAIVGLLLLVYAIIRRKVIYM